MLLVAYACSYAFVPTRFTDAVSYATFLSFLFVCSFSYTMPLRVFHLLFLTSFVSNVFLCFSLWFRHMFCSYYVPHILCFPTRFPMCFRVCVYDIFTFAPPYAFFFVYFVPHHPHHMCVNYVFRHNVFSLSLFLHVVFLCCLPMSCYLCYLTYSAPYVSTTHIHCPYVFSRCVYPIRVHMLCLICFVSHASYFPCCFPMRCSFDFHCVLFLRRVY